MRQLLLCICCFCFALSPMAAQSNIIINDSTMFIGEQTDTLTEEQRYFNPLYLIVQKGKEFLKQQLIRGSVCDCDTNIPNRHIGIFSVAPDRHVTFSQGNLQYFPADNLWKFADKQYEHLGNANKYISHTFRNWVDLFGYSNTITPFGVSTSTNPADYVGDFIDWGENAICGDAPNTWRTLSHQEWTYLLKTRTNATKLYGVAQVAGVNGFIILPDNWTAPQGIKFKAGLHKSQVTDYSVYQSFTAEQWLAMEDAGAVFLPAAGYRHGNDLEKYQISGYYWSSTTGNDTAAYRMYFYSNSLRLDSYSNYRGRSVRLVQDVQNIVWYTDEAPTHKGTTSYTPIERAGRAYIIPDEQEGTELNRHYAGKRINCIRLRVAKTGAFTVAVVDRDNLNTILNPQTITLNYLDSKEAQTFILPQTIHLQENQVLVFGQPTDQGSYYYQSGTPLLGYYYDIKKNAAYARPSQVKSLQIDAGYHCNKDICDTIAQTLQLSITDTTLYTNESLTINTLPDNRIDGDIQWTLSSSTLASITNTSADGCTLTALKPDTLILTALAVNSPNVRAQCKIIIRDRHQSGVFSIRGDKQIVFAPGNLQYTLSTNTWNFAKEQYEILGKANIEKDTLANHIDLFGWSANNTTAPFGVSTSTKPSDYAGTFIDWGRNTICGDAPNTWRTLTQDEWEYLLNKRTDAKKLHSRAQINGVNGLIFLPDDWICPQGVTFQPSASTYEQQVITLEQWRKFEATGAVFLPAAGRRDGKSFKDINAHGNYFSATRKDNNYAEYLAFTDEKLYVDAQLKLTLGRSIRLVRDTVVPEFVDLGLSVKWATFNVGAKAPEDIGYYLAWGETSPKTKYNWANYKWCEGTAYTLTKYCTNADYGKVDNIATLAPEDDAATVHWKDKWRTPTYEELDELRTKCTWDWIRFNGVNGYKVTSKVAGYTDKSIFLPAAGYRSGTSTSSKEHGYYQCSSLYTGDPDECWRLYFYSTSKGLTHTSFRYIGWSVRPVYGESTITTPTVETIAATQITEHSALVGGKVMRDGKTPIIEFGIVYSTTPQPTTADYKIIDNAGFGLYFNNLTNLQANTTYYARAFATNAIGTTYGTEVSFTTGSITPEETTGIENGHAYVDLGLSVLWATCNIGATTPEEYGHYFAWGETEPKTQYTWTNYKWCEGTDETLTKYCTNADYGIVDNLTLLEPEDDAATVNWGGNWRTPTYSEVVELKDQCTWVWTIQNGVKGHKVTSNINGNSIFLPAAGYKSSKTLYYSENKGYYQSSSSVPHSTKTAYHIHFKSSYISISNNNRYISYPNRPVCNEVQVKKPSVTTYQPNQVAETSAIISGRVTNNGGANIIEHGVVYGTSKYPTIKNNKVLSTDGLSEFYCHLTGLLPDTIYYARAFATNKAGTSYGSQVSFRTMNSEVSQPSGSENGYGYVDIGLSVKWATCNIGSTTPEGYGDYYAWGEKTPKNQYDWTTYLYCNPTDTMLTKYCVELKHGYVDNRVTLESRDDIATQLGGKWRMPTDEEWTELRTQCTWYWLNKNNINGYKIVGKNGNSIFLPAAGYKFSNLTYDEGTDGSYWSASLYTDLSLYAHSILFNSKYIYRQYNGRFCGLSIRPVYEGL